MAVVEEGNGLHELRLSIAAIGVRYLLTGDARYSPVILLSKQLVI